MNKWRKNAPRMYKADEVWTLDVERHYYLRVKRVGTQWYVDPETDSNGQGWTPINAATTEEAKAVAIAVWRMQ